MHWLGSLSGYGPQMQVVLIKTLLALCICLGIGAIGYAIATAMASISPSKGRYKWIATLLFGSAICGSLATFALTQLLTSHVFGNISSAQVHPDRKNYRTEVRLQTSTGGKLVTYAHGRSFHFRPGQHVALNYQERTGMIVKAQFIGPDGKEEGVFNSSDSWTAGIGLLCGLFIIWVAFKVNKRDPEALKKARALRKTLSTL